MKLDDFDAVFRSAVKDRFKLAQPALESVMLVTDMLPTDAAVLETSVRRLLAGLPEGVEHRTVGADEYRSIDELLALIQKEAPSILVCYRHLLGRDKELRHSLGSTVDTLTQVCEQPVLLLPPPTRANFDQLTEGLERVLVVTDHLSGSDELVNWGVTMWGGGTLYLAHVEDKVVFDRYMDVVGMIPDIDTDTTRDRIRTKLLERPADYVAHIAEVLAEAEVAGEVVPVVTMADSLADYRDFFVENDVQLVVMNTKDANQLAMHGMAYAISVEIQDRPLLLL